VSSLTGSRRTYVAPRRGLRRRLRVVSLPLPVGAGPGLALGIALIVALCAFVVGGGALERTTWTEVGLLLAGGATCAVALVAPRPAGTPARLRGAWAVAAFAALAIYTALSISWSLVPSDSWLEASRTLSYLAVMAGGVALGRLAPRRWGAVLHGIGLAAVAISGWALLTKVFPGALDKDETFARLRPPFDYWNSVGLSAALGIPPLLWLAARRSGHAAINALAWPGLGLLTVCLLLSYSRGALLAIGIGLALWLAFVPLRLRTVSVLGAVLVVTVPVIAWAFAQDGMTRDRPPLGLRIDAGQQLGALLLLTIVALLVVGLAVGFLGDHHPPGTRTRERAGRVLFGALVVVPAVAILMLANAPGGITGQVSKAYHRAVDPSASTPSNTPARLAETSSVRSRYWREALKVHAEAPWLGTGAGSFGTLRLRFRSDTTTVQHAHGYVVQTLADLGWIGLGLSLLATIAWLVVAARASGLARSARGLPWDAERVGIAALAVVAIVFGVHSAIDWTWFAPGNAVPALICAGFVAARGPLRERLGAPAREHDTPLGVLRPAAAVVVLGFAAIASWAALQPVRSAHAEDAAFARLGKGQLAAAASIAQIAHERDPLATDPLFDIAAIAQARGDVRGAERAYEQAVQLEPATAETWRRLGRFKLFVTHDNRAALRDLQTAYFLDPRSFGSVSDIVKASRAVQGG
jgi:hypothetical protein